MNKQTGEGAADQLKDADGEGKGAVDGILEGDKEDEGREEEYKSGEKLVQHLDGNSNDSDISAQKTVNLDAKFKVSTREIKGITVGALQ